MILLSVSVPILVYRPIDIKLIALHVCRLEWVQIVRHSRSPLRCRVGSMLLHRGSSSECEPRYRRYSIPDDGHEVALGMRLIA